MLLPVQLFKTSRLEHSTIMHKIHKSLTCQIFTLELYLNILKPLHIGILNNHQNPNKKFTGSNALECMLTRIKILDAVIQNLRLNESQGKTIFQNRFRQK